MSKLLRRAAALAGLCAAFLASAQDFPSRPITMVVPFGAGGYNDVSGRIMAQKLTEILGQPVTVENRTGAAGAIGANSVAKAKPDGYTLGFFSSGPLSSNVSLYKSLPYDPAKDFAPISRVSISPNVLVVQPSFPANNLAEFLTYAKQNPRKINYATAGNGSGPHMNGILFESMAGIEMASVPYRGGAQQITDLLGGQVQASFNPVLEVVQHIQGGKLKAIAVSSLKPVTVLPKVPAIADTLPGFEFLTWNGIVAPAGTPPEVVKRLNDATLKALADPGVAAALAQLGLEAAGSTPAEFGQYIQSQIAFFGRLAKIAQIQPE